MSERDQERAAFEAWAAGMDLRREYEGYADNNVHLIWHGWQARASLSVEQDKPKVRILWEPKTGELDVQMGESPLVTDLDDVSLHEPSGCKCGSDWTICKHFEMSTHPPYCVWCPHHESCHATPSSLVEK